MHARQSNLEQQSMDQEDFSHTDETSAKEAELMTLTVNLVQGVIKLARGYRNSDKSLKKVRMSDTPSTTLAPLLEAYMAYKEHFSEGLIPENYFRKKLKVYKVIAMMLLQEKFPET